MISFSWKHRRSNDFFSNFFGNPPLSSSAFVSHLRVEELEQKNTVSTMMGVTGDNMLVSFNTNSPNVITNSVNITNLAGTTGEEQVVGLSYRPRTGQLYGIGVETVNNQDLLRLYMINPLTGVATQVGSNSITLPPALYYEVSINPAADVLRVESTADVNIRVNLNNGSLISSDTTFKPASLLIDGIAYDRNFNGNLGTNGTTLYGIARNGNQLVTIGGINQNPSPNNGAVTSIGPLGVNISPTAGVGFVIPPSGTAGGTGYAVLTDNNTNLTGLYAINLATGAAIKVGNVGSGTTPLNGLAAVPNSVIAVGSGPGTNADVRVVNGNTGEQLMAISPFNGYLGGVSVALGDVNRDSVPDIIVGAGAGAPGGHVKVYDGATGNLIYSFLAFPGFTGGVQVASGDVNGDGYADIIVAAEGSSGAQVKIFSGQNGTLLSSFGAYPGYNGQFAIAAGDINGNGLSEIVTAAAANGHIKIFNAQGGGATTPGIPNSFLENNGVYRNLSVAVGDVNFDGRPDIIVGEQYGDGLIKVFSGANGSQILNFNAYPGGATGGVNVAVGDVTSSGEYSIRTMPAGTGNLASLGAFSGFDASTQAAFTPFLNYAGSASIAGYRVS